MTGPRIVRPTEAQQREKLARLRSEMTEMEPPEVPEPEPDEPEDVPRVDFATLLEDEIRELLTLDYRELPANQRHYLIRAGVALWAAKNAKGPTWGAGLDEVAS